MSAELERLEELLADRAVQRLTEAEQRELDGLLARHPEVDALAYERAAAALALGFEPNATEPLPAALRAHALERWDASQAPRLSVAAPSASPRRPSRAWIGWAAAAALLVAALAGWWPRERAPHAPSLAELRAAVDAAPDRLVVAWKPTEDPAGRAAGGEIVWSTREQRGYMRLRGLPVNDPARAQYQLWIFDAGRDERYPIDGGVFDVTAAGEVLVPIDAKLAVQGPKMFALTLEVPGGVVVSAREHLVALGQT